MPGLPPRIKGTLGKVRFKHPSDPNHVQFANYRTDDTGTVYFHSSLDLNDPHIRDECKHLERDRWGSYTLAGDLFECNCLSAFDRTNRANLRDVLDNNIISWCSAQDKKQITILSLGSGGLLQEAILNEKLHALGFEVVFICVDPKYSGFPLRMRIDGHIAREQSKTQNSSSENHYPNRYIPSIGFFEEKAVTHFGPKLITVCNLEYASYAIKHKLCPRPDLLMSADFITHLYADTPYHWHNFAWYLIEQRLLDVVPELTSFVADNGVVKTFKGMDEVKCEIPQPDGTILVRGVEAEESCVLEYDGSCSKMALARRVINVPIQSGCNLKSIAPGKEYLELQSIIRVKAARAEADRAREAATQDEQVTYLMSSLGLSTVTGLDTAEFAEPTARPRP